MHEVKGNILLFSLQLNKNVLCSAKTHKETFYTSLLKKMEVTDVSGLGKVRVILRVANSGVIDENKRGGGSFFQLDKKIRIS